MTSTPSFDQAKQAIQNMERHELIWLGGFKALELVDGIDINLHDAFGTKAHPENLQSVIQIVKDKRGQFRDTGFFCALNTVRLTVFIDYMAHEFRASRQSATGYSKEFAALEHVMCIVASDYINSAVDELQEKAGRYFLPEAFEEARLHVENHELIAMAMHMKASLRTLSAIIFEL